MSTEDMSEYIFTWRIKNYSLCYQARGDSIESPSFTVESIPDSEWCLCLYPKGTIKLNNDGSFISVFLAWKPLREGANVTVSYTFEIVEEKGRVLKSCTLNKEFKKAEYNWGYDRFFKSAELEKEINCSAEDVLTLRCRMKGDQNWRLKLSESTACTIIEVDACCVKWRVKMLSQFEYAEKLAFQVLEKLYDLEITLNSMENKMAISIHFRNNDKSESPQQLTFTFSLFDKIGYKLGSKRAGHLYKDEETWHFPDFITKESLKCCEVNSSHYEFKLMCEVKNSKRSMSSSVEILEFISPCSLKSKERDLAISAKQNNFRKMFIDKTYPDVTIRCNNDEFPVHKLVLKVQSPVFAAMFDQDMQENKTGFVDITDIDVKTLKAFLEYLYTETVDKMDYEMAKKQMLIADKYQVPSLVEECASYLKSILSTENVCEVIAIADMIHCEPLKSNALNFIKVNASDILLTSEWPKWIEGNIKLATFILSELSAFFGNNSSICDKSLS